MVVPGLMPPRVEEPGEPGFVEPWLEPGRGRCRSAACGLVLSGWVRGVPGGVHLAAAVPGARCRAATRRARPHTVAVPAIEPETESGAEVTAVARGRGSARRGARGECRNAPRAERREGRRAEVGRPEQRPGRTAPVATIPTRRRSQHRGVFTVGRDHPAQRTQAHAERVTAEAEYVAEFVAESTPPPAGFTFSGLGPLDVELRLGPRERGRDEVRRGEERGRKARGLPEGTRPNPAGARVRGGCGFPWCESPDGSGGVLKSAGRLRRPARVTSHVRPAAEDTVAPGVPNRPDAGHHFEYEVI